MRFIEPVKDYFLRARQQFSWADLKWSYIIIGGMMLACIPISVLLPNGWTLWPMMPVLAMLIIINETADRNGQGVPPFQVYAFFGMVIGVWVIGVIVMSKVNAFVQLLAVGVLAYYSAKAWILQRERQRLIQARRNEGCCIHCGEPADPEEVLCDECGLEVDPERTSEQRRQAIGLHGGKSGRARKILQPEGEGTIAARKEKSLLANSPRRRGRPPKKR